MHRYAVSILLAASWACSTPASHTEPPTYPESPAAGDARDAPDAKPTRLGVHITTTEDLERVLGIHHHFLYLANNVCGRRLLECGQDLGEDIGVSSCEIIVAQEWCRENDCKSGFLQEPHIYKDPCRHIIHERACNDLTPPLECESVAAAGLVLRLDAWPEGEVVDPYKTFLRGPVPR